MLLAVVLAVTMQAEFTFMTFNVRYATSADGENAWVHRQGLVYEVVNRHRPDVLGVQEALASQVDDLLAHLPGYAYVGVGRDDGRRAGEFSALFYRRDVFEAVESGTFWLSDTPDVAGSKSWGNNVVRVCTWARLRAKWGLTITVFNTHFDHESQPSREKSAELVLARVAGVTEPSVVMGDLNSGEDNAAVQEFLRSGMKNAFRAANPTTTVGTFNGFARLQDGPMIDHIFVSRHWGVLASDIDRASFDGRFPSDHFPVWARLVLVGP